MSGGRWNYGQRNLGYEMFPGCEVCYGLGDDSRNKYGDYTGSVKRARQLNPMEDRQLSELVFDVLCLIYSADWYQSGDISEETYQEDVAYFKQKWVFQSTEKMTKAEIDKSVEALREELYQSLMPKEET